MTEISIRVPMFPITHGVLDCDKDAYEIYREQAIEVSCLNSRMVTKGRCLRG